METLAVVYSYTQISQYLRCPRSYRLRYLDGWREKDVRASMIFGRCFEKALGAYFCGEDGATVLFKEWETYRDVRLDFGKAGSWDKTLHQGINLLHKFAQEDRIRIFNPEKNLQLKLLRPLTNGGEFVAYIDAVGEIDGQRFLIDWKTTTSRYAEEPEGLLSLDPQLICYSWISGIREVALVVFVRKHLPEIQYLTASISESQQKEFGDLVESAVGRIEAGQFPRHTGIRFPMN
ncbi:MAG: PD-(D/E)XK nuclease family protein, partial [Candidatus Acidiferrales bacterium]